MASGNNSKNPISRSQRHRGRWYMGIAGVVIVGYSLWFAYNGRIGTRGGGFSEENPGAAALIGGLFVLIGVLMVVIAIRGRTT